MTEWQSTSSGEMMWRNQDYEDILAEAHALRDPKWIWGHSPAFEQQVALGIAINTPSIQVSTSDNVSPHIILDVRRGAVFGPASRLHLPSQMPDNLEVDVGPFCRLLESTGLQQSVKAYLKCLAGRRFP